MKIEVPLTVAMTVMADTDMASIADVRETKDDQKALAERIARSLVAVSLSAVASSVIQIGDVEVGDIDIGDTTIEVDASKSTKKG